MSVNRVCLGRVVGGGFNAKINLKGVRYLYIEEYDRARCI